jgi:hypothetical protein
MGEPPQGHVHLPLQPLFEVRSAAPEVQIRPDGRLGTQLMKSPCERMVSDGVSAPPEEGRDECTIAGQEDVEERYGRDLGAVRDRQFDDRGGCLRAPRS